MKQIPDNSIDLVIIDPPYEFTTGGGGGAFGTKKRQYHSEYKKVYGHSANLGIEKIASEIKDISEGFDFSIFEQLDRVMKRINIYIWCSRKQVGKIINYYEKKNCNVDIICWHKDDPIPMCGASYLSDTEYCIFARQDKVSLYGEVNTKRKFYVTHCNREDKKKYKHPTIKPIKIIKNLIINSSKEEEIVLDCFSGSGTTCVAAKELNRQFIGIEINKEYYKISIDRLNGILANGQISFDTILNKN